MIGSAAAVTALATAAGVGFAVFGGEDRALTLEVTSPYGYAAGVSWSSPDDGYVDHEHGSGNPMRASVELPWRTTIQVDSAEGAVSVGAMAVHGEAIGCRILRGDVVLAEKSSGIGADCIVTIRRAFGAGRTD
ncbi:hypothetical protein GCM10009661_32430 [Catellatospora chokoriensis]|uniref:MmpS family membrane protein n=1 Tax=Catellatospora chokoriensis TaxID=310353 RepID=A0A8J3NT54_9ACTN|nr:hypothetical protein Cch02nite_47900 [Catellatospora chokoriensis]